MADLKLVNGDAGQRQPISLGIPKGAKLSFDFTSRVIVIPARNEVLLDTYLVGIPMAVVKQMAAQIAMTEVQMEVTGKPQAPRPS